MTLTCQTCAHQSTAPPFAQGKRPLPKIIPSRDHHCPRCQKITRHFASLQDRPTDPLQHLEPS